MLMLLPFRGKSSKIIFWNEYMWQIILIQQKHSYLSEHQEEDGTEEQSLISSTQVICFFCWCYSKNVLRVSCHDFTLHGLVEAVQTCCWSLLQYILESCSSLTESSHFFFAQRVWETFLKSCKVKPMWRNKGTL